MSLEGLPMTQLMRGKTKPKGAGYDLEFVRSAAESRPSSNHNMGHKSQWKGSPDGPEMAGH